MSPSLIIQTRLLNIIISMFVVLTAVWSSFVMDEKKNFFLDYWIFDAFLILLICERASSISTIMYVYIRK